MESVDDVEAVAVFEAKIDHGEGGRSRIDGAEACRNGFGAAHLEATLFHRALEAGEEGLVVVDKEQGAVAGRQKFVDSAHVLLI